MTDANVNANNDTGTGAPTTGEANPGASTTGRRGRRSRRAATGSGAITGGREATAGASANREIIPDATADLSGTYAGRVSDEALGVTYERATLTINGSSYTLVSASLSRSGRFIVNTTQGYIAVTMELGPPAPGQPIAPFISVRARRVGADRLILTTVPGERQRFSFK